MTGRCVPGLIAALGCVMAAAASAQSGAPPAGVEISPKWRLDTSPPKAAGKAGTAPRIRAKTPAAQDGRIAHQLQLQKEFFEKQAKAPPAKPESVPEFGGYDAARDAGDGSVRPAAGLKF